MWRLFTLVWIFSFFQFGDPLLADESRGTKQSAGDLIKQLRDSDPDKVCAAAQALGRRGPAKDATKALAELLKTADGRVRWTAAEALWRLEYPAGDLVPVYAELLTALDPDVRAASAWRLGRLGIDARQAVPVLAAALRDESLEVRAQVGQALANLGELAEPALPALVRALGDQQLDENPREDEGAESVRRSPALPALVELGEKAIPLLIESFRAKDAERRREEPSGTRHPALRAAHAFPAFGPRAVPPLIRALEAKDTATRQFAAAALREMARFGGLPEDAAEKLEGLLEDRDKEVRVVAVEAMSWVRPSNTKAVTILEKTRAERAIGAPELLAHLERMCPHNEAARKLLLTMLGDDDKETVQKAHRILAECPLPADQAMKTWTAALSHADPEVRRTAVAALAGLGPGARSAKVTLRGRFAKEADYYCKGGILDALVAIDPDDAKLVPLLIKSLDDGESWVRLQALGCISRLGPRAKDALPRLEASLLNPQAKGRKDILHDSEMRNLVEAIVRVAPGSARTAVTLLKALRLRDVRSVRCPKNTWHMRDQLEDELFDYLPAATTPLCEALKDKDAEVRKSAALVLLRAGRETKAALPVLMENLWGGKEDSHEHRRFQSRVVELLSRRQTQSTEAIAAAWCEAWRTARPDERATLEQGLLVFQPEALPHLLEQLRQAKSAESRRDLARLLARFEGQSKVVVPILRKELRESKPARHYPAAQALALLGPDAADAVPELVKLLSSSHPAVRAVAARALASMGRAAKPAVPRLEEMLEDSRQELRVVAASSLGQIDPGVSKALALLRDALVREKDTGTFRVFSEIERPEGVEGDAVFPNTIEEGIACFGERAVPVLAEILEDAGLDEWTARSASAQCGAYARVRAAQLLAKLGPDAHKAVPALTRALSDRDPFVRDAAASALGRIGPAAKEAASACINLFKEQNRLASGGQAWASRAQGTSRNLRHGGRGLTFDFRSLGRGKSLSRDYGFGYGFERDPYAHLLPAYPSDAAHVLSRIDAKACSALPVLREAAKDSDHPARLSATLSIWRCGRESPDLIRAFTAALEAHASSAKGTRSPLPREVRECLAELGAELKPALGDMAEWLKQLRSAVDVKDLAAVVEAIGHLGADARQQADLLRPMLRGDRWEARRRVAAALALFRILGDKDIAFPILREVLLGMEEHGSFYHWPDMADTARVHAARALGVLAEKGDEQARSLIAETAKGDENPHVRVAALEAMARLKGANAAAVKGLCAALRHHDADVRAAAAAACGRLGPLAKASADALKLAAEGDGLAVRQAARQALGAVE